ncbi:MAG: AlpA family phage regulatory protein [Thermoanaerobaculia bacterium]
MLCVSRLRRAKDRKGQPIGAPLYMRIGERLFPAPIRLGVRMVAWRYSEVVAVNEARLRGATDDELRELVGVLEAAPKAL